MPMLLVSDPPTQRATNAFEHARVSTLEGLKWITVGDEAHHLLIVIQHHHSLAPDVEKVKHVRQ